MAIKNIVLDPGHGGIDEAGKYTTAPSKMHVFEDGTTAYEGVLNREIMHYVQECLSVHADLNVMTTVNADDPTDLPLKDRVAQANALDPQETIFVSIHCNAGGGTGFEIFTTRGETKSDTLAEAIANAVENVYQRNNLRLRYDFSDGDKDKEVDFYVLRKTKCPAVLLECGFFDNRGDFERLRDPEFQGDLGSFIYTGIINYVYHGTNE